MTKALTLWQPWATLVATGRKTVETRSWRTNHRGRLVIHAAQRWGPLCPDGGTCHHECRAQCYRVTCCAPLASAGFGDDWPAFPVGKIVATAYLIDCVPMVNAERPDMLFDRQVLAITPSGQLVLADPATPSWNWVKVNDQRPFGDFAPGRWAWLLDDIKPTTGRCPACNGDGLRRAFDDSDQPSRWGGTTHPCPICDGAGRCDPIPAKGRQGLWNWGGKDR